MEQSNTVRVVKVVFWWCGSSNAQNQQIKLEQRILPVDWLLSGGSRQLHPSF